MSGGGCLSGGLPSRSRRMRFDDSDEFAEMMAV